MAPQAKKPSRAWEALTPPLAQWILDYVSSKGFERMTPVQKSTLELFRGNKDVVVEAVTGSGKTLAYLIPVLERLTSLDEPLKRNHVGAVILLPTRELAQQVYGVLLELLRFHPASSDLIPYLRTSDEKRPLTTDPVIVPQLLVGGMTKATEDLRLFLAQSPNVLVGTPGRLAELLSSPHVKTAELKVLILDEADKVLEKGFSEDVSKALSLLPKQRRTGLFSASVSEAVQSLISVGLRYPHKITVRVKSVKDGSVIGEQKTPVSLQMSYVVVPSSEKLPALCQLLERLEPRPQRSIVFMATCAQVKYMQRVLPALLPQGFGLVALHSKMEPKARVSAFERFVSSTNPTILLCTDLASRGLDIPQMDLVVQMDPPNDQKAFLHRCGRAGRAGRRGLAIVMLRPGREEEYIELLTVRKTPITPLTRPLIAVDAEESSQAADKIRSLALADRDIFELAQRGFVSWARAYQEHQAKSIFRIDDVDWIEMAKGWGLLQLPKMPELKKLDLDRSLGLGIDVDAITFKDKGREKKRQVEIMERLAARESGADAAAKDEAAQKRKRNEAWSGKHEKEDVKVERRERKRKKRDAERFSKMTESEKEEQKKLDELIGQVKRQTQAMSSQRDEEFEGFED